MSNTSNINKAYKLAVEIASDINNDSELQTPYNVYEHTPTSRYMELYLYRKERVRWDEIHRRYILAKDIAKSHGVEFERTPYHTLEGKDALSILVGQILKIDFKMGNCVFFATVKEPN